MYIVKMKQNNKWLANKFGKGPMSEQQHTKDMLKSDVLWPACLYQAKAWALGLQCGPPP